MSDISAMTRGKDQAREDSRGLEESAAGGSLEGSYMYYYAASR